MSEKEKKISIITGLATFFHKDWSKQKINKIVDNLENNVSSKYVDQAVKRILKTESELGTNPIPQIIDKIGIKKG